MFGILRGVINATTAATDTVIDVASDAVEVGTLGLVEKDQATTLLKSGYSIAETAAMTNLTIDVVSSLLED